jgi:hypothetical protein
MLDGSLNERRMQEMKRCDVAFGTILSRERYTHRSLIDLVNMYTSLHQWAHASHHPSSTRSHLSGEPITGMLCNRTTFRCAQAGSTGSTVAFPQFADMWRSPFRSLKAAQDVGTSEGVGVGTGLT